MTNLDIVESYKEENNITCELLSFNEWKKAGYIVVKGQKAKHKLLLWKKVEKTDKKTGEIEKKFIKKSTALFEPSQVKKIEKDVMNHA